MWEKYVRFALYVLVVPSFGVVLTYVNKVFFEIQRLALDGRASYIFLDLLDGMLLSFSFAVLLFAYSDFIKFKKRSRRLFIEEKCSTKPDSTVLALESLYSNAVMARRAAINSIILFVVFVILTAIFIVYAGKFSEIDRLTIGQDSDLYGLKQSLVAQQKAASDELSLALRVPDKKIDGMKDENYFEQSAVKEKVQYLRNQISRLDSQIERVNEEILISITKNRKLSNIDENAIVDKRMIATTILRISITAVLIFLSLVLLKNHRRYAATADAYMARYNALIVSNNIDYKFEEIIYLMSTEDIAFGVDPNHPFEETTRFINKGALVFTRLFRRTNVNRAKSSAIEKQDMG